MKVKLLEVLLFIAALAALGCQKQTKPSIYILAVDHLAHFKINCDDSTMNQRSSGIAILCQESIRFTHAYTSSTLSIPAMGSVLTGLYPFQNNLRTNSSPGLSPQYVTLSELAMSQGYETYFFSSGAPLTSKSGLSQGFKHFYDSYDVQNIDFISAEKLFNKSTAITKDRDSTFQFFYHNDLNYTNTITKTDDGEFRNKTLQSQIEEFDESLYNFINQLKKSKQWDSSIFILTGLNGVTESHIQNQFKPLNLHSENTQVSLFIKMPSKIHNESHAWSIDKKMSLADLGKTLFELVDPNYKFLDNSIINSRSFLKDLIIPLTNKNKKSDFIEKPIIIETGLGEQLGQLGFRLAFLNENYLIIHDKIPQIYNTLSDRLELNPLSLQLIPKDIQEKFKSFIDSTLWPPWKQQLHDGLVLYLNQDKLYNSELENDFINFAKNYRWQLDHKEETTLQNKLLSSLIHAFIFKITAQESYSSLENWKKKIELTFSKTALLKNNNFLQNEAFFCSFLLTNNVYTQSFYKNCRSSLNISFYDWIFASKNNIHNDKLFKVFFKFYLRELQSERIRNININLNFVLDPNPIQSIFPPESIIALSQSQLKNYRKYLNALLNSQKPIPQSNNFDFEDDYSEDQ